jgi:hypothetical protein
MRLALDPSPSYNFPVAISVRQEDGSLGTATVRLRFKRLDQNELHELLERYQKAIDPSLRERLDKAAQEGTLDELETQLETESTTAAVKSPIDAMRDELRSVIVGWNPQDMVGDAEFSEASLEKLLLLPGAAATIFYRFGDSIPVAQAKNSKRSP